MNKQREDGYYWVKVKAWKVMEFLGGKWVYNGTPTLDDFDFIEINNTRILSPDENRRVSDEQFN